MCQSWSVSLTRLGEKSFLFVSKTANLGFYNQGRGECYIRVRNCPQADFKSRKSQIKSQFIIKDHTEAINIIKTLITRPGLKMH